MGRSGSGLRTYWRSASSSKVERASQIALSCLQARLRHAQPMRPAGQRGLFAHLLRGQQVLRGGFEIALFAEQFAETAIQIRRADGQRRLLFVASCSACR